MKVTISENPANKYVAAILLNVIPLVFHQFLRSQRMKTTKTHPILCLTETKPKIEIANSFLLRDLRQAYKLSVKNRIEGVSEVGYNIGATKYPEPHKAVNKIILMCELAISRINFSK